MKKFRNSLSLKTGAMLLIASLILSTVAVGVSFFVYKNTMEKQYSEMTGNLAHTEAVVLDKDTLAKLTDMVMKIYREQVENYGGEIDFDAMSAEEEQTYFAAFDVVRGTKEYQEIEKLLRKLANANDVASIYIAYMDVETNNGVYIIDCSDEPCLTGTCDVIEAGNLEHIKAGEYDFPAYITNYEEYGWLCTAAAGVLDDKGNIIADAYVDTSMDEVVMDRMNFLKTLAMMLVSITLIMIVIVIYVFSKMVVLPINKLARITHDFVSDGYVGTQEKSENLKIKTDDEIGVLYDSVSKMRTDIQEYIDNLTAVTAEKERISVELNVATQIQAQMLPSIFPAFPERFDFDVYASMRPAKEVGGDFYDFFLVDEKHLAIVMADVSGKGVPAALFMVISKTMIKNRAQMGGTPAEILYDVNMQLCEGNEEDFFVTVWLAIIDVETGKVVEANGGHEHPVIKRANGDFELIRNRHSLALGAMEGVRFRQHEFQLDPGDRLFVYTDGLPEATDLDNNMFGVDRMLQSLNKRKDATPKEVLDGCTNDVDEFMGEAPQFDDITMLCLDYLGRK